MIKMCLADICSLNMGQSPNSSSYNTTGEGIPFYQGNADFGKVSPKTTTWCTEPKKIAEPGDILLSVRAPIGAINIANEKCCIGRGLVAISPASENIRASYIKQALLASRKNLEFLGSGSTFKAIGKKSLGEFLIPVYSLPMQIEIENRFSQVSICFELLRDVLKKLDELVKSRFIEMFGDPEAPDFPYMMVELGDVLRKPASNGFFAKRKDYVEDGNVEILGVANVVNRMYSGIDNLPKTNGTSADIEKYSLSYGDMLFCRSSLVLEGIGKASIVPREVRPNTLFECHVIRMPLDISVCVPEFMQLQSTLPAFRKQVMTKAKTATMTTIDQKSLLSIKVFLPPIEEQKYFLSFIEQVDKLKFDFDFLVSFSIPSICLFCLKLDP